MPLYTNMCECGHRETVFSKIADRDIMRFCSDCLSPLKRIVEAPSLASSFKPYQSPIDGHWVESPSSRRDDLKRNGCIEWDPGLKQDLPRIRESNLEKILAPMEKTIESTVLQMASSGHIPT